MMRCPDVVGRPIKPGHRVYWSERMGTFRVVKVTLKTAKIQVGLNEYRWVSGSDLLRATWRMWFQGFFQ